MDNFAVVFDMDGVIFDSERLVLDCWKLVADRHGIPDIETTMRRCLGLNAAATEQLVKERYGNDFDYKGFKAENSALFHELADGGRLPLKPGVRELLSGLKARNIKIALASSTRKQVVEQELKDAGLYDFFDIIVCGDMVSKSKPDPEIYLKACELLAVAPEAAYAIEDSHNGIKSAFAAGMKPIMVPDLMAASEEMKNMVIFVKKDLFEVLDYFKAIRL
ncbi:MAG: HAD family phosphatase [Lachnospiraceae bacterium]|nr:HAD family phosphatase [Lachnospiraceae bacterium]